MNLIDKDALIKDLIAKGFYPVFVKAAIERQEVVQAIRCRDCIFWNGERETDLRECLLHDHGDSYDTTFGDHICTEGTDYRIYGGEDHERREAD